MSKLSFSFKRKPEGEPSPGGTASKTRWWGWLRNGRISTVPVVERPVLGDSNAALVFGVHYERSLEGSGYRREGLAKLRKSTNSELGAIINGKRTSSNQYVFAVAPNFKPKRGKTYYAAGAALALSPDLQGQDCLIALELGQGLAYVTQSTASGLPNTEREWVGPIGDLVEKLRTWSTRDVKAIYFHVADAGVSAELQALSHLSQYKDLLNFHPHATTKLERKKSNWLMPSCLAFLLLAGVWNSWDSIEAHVQALNKVQRDAAALKSRRVQFQAVADEFVKSNWYGPPALFAEKVLPTLMTIPLIRNGWRFEHLDCDLMKRECLSYWQRKEGDYAGFAESTDPKRMLADENYKILRHTEELDFLAAATPFPANALPSVTENVLTVGDLQSTFTFAGLVSDPITKPKEVAKWEGPGAVPASMTLPLVGDWSLEGKVSLIEAMQALPNNLTPLTFSLRQSSSGKITFKTSGKYYVK